MMTETSSSPFLAPRTGAVDDERRGDGLVRLSLDGDAGRAQLVAHAAGLADDEPHARVLTALQEAALELGAVHAGVRALEAAIALRMASAGS